MWWDGPDPDHAGLFPIPKMSNYGCLPGTGGRSPNGPGAGLCGGEERSRGDAEIVQTEIEEHWSPTFAEPILRTHYGFSVSRAVPRSARMSSMFSSPTERRMRFSVIPASRRSIGSMEAWVMLTG